MYTSWCRNTIWTLVVVIQRQRGLMWDKNISTSLILGKVNEIPVLFNISAWSCSCWKAGLIRYQLCSLHEHLHVNFLLCTRQFLYVEMFLLRSRIWIELFWNLVHLFVRCDILDPPAFQREPLPYNFPFCMTFNQFSGVCERTWIS